MNKKRIGLVGLGLMGSGMAKNILSYGFPLIGYDVDGEKVNSIIEIGGKKGIMEPEYRGNFEDTDRNREREIFERFCDSSKVQQLLNWRPEVSLEEGIRKIMEIGVIFERWENLYDEQN